MSRLLYGLLVCWFALVSVQTSAAEPLVIPGTGDSQELLRGLAHAFMVAHPETVIEIPESIGSTGGIKNVLSERAVLARVARSLRADESLEGLQYLHFAFSPVVFAAHLESPCIRNLSSEQVLGIYTGAISDWDQLGQCPSHKIYVARRESGDSSRTVIESYLPPFMVISDPAGEIIYSTPETVQVLENHPNTIAYVPLSALRHSSLSVLTFDGTAPTAENVRAGRYPLIVRLGLVWKGTLPPLAEQFMDYLFTPAAQTLIREQGLVPASSRN